MAHQHYKGTGQMHSFRGLVAHNTQQKIRIEGATGDIAWRITKFAIMPNTPGGAVSENVVKVYRERQTSITQTVDFNDAELLAAGFFLNQSSTTNPYYDAVIFDNALFSRNIYVTAHDNVGSLKCNYYIELEEVKISAAGMAQLAVGAARRNRFSSE